MNILHHVAELLDGFPGIPAPMVMVVGRTVSISFHAVDGDAPSRVAAVDMLLAAVGGSAAANPNGYYSGAVSDWHGHWLDVCAHDVATVGVA